jgi:protein-disulfide isomerase
MEDSQKQKDGFLLPASILVAAFLIGGAIIYSAGSKNVSQTANLGDAVAIQDLLEDDVILGNPNAPVAIVEFGDYQCSFCGRFFLEVEPRIREEYIKTGKAKMVYRDFAFLGSESQGAALASQCAAEQGKFWAYHDELFESEIADSRVNNGNLSPEFLKSLAVKLGLNAAQFNSCLDSQKYKAEVEKDYNDGVAAGVRGTPATFINGKMISGAVSYENFKSLIEEALANR